MPFALSLLLVFPLFKYYNDKETEWKDLNKWLTIKVNLLWIKNITRNILWLPLHYGNGDTK